MGSPCLYILIVWILLILQKFASISKTTKIANIYATDQLILVPILIGNPPKISQNQMKTTKINEWFRPIYLDIGLNPDNGNQMLLKRGGSRVCNGPIQKNRHI